MCAFYIECAYKNFILFQWKFKWWITEMFHPMNRHIDWIFFSEWTSSMACAFPFLIDECRMFFIPYFHIHMFVFLANFSFPCSFQWKIEVHCRRRHRSSTSKQMIESRQKAFYCRGTHKKFNKISSSCFILVPFICNQKWDSAHFYTKKTNKFENHFKLKFNWIGFFNARNTTQCNANHTDSAKMEIQFVCHD